MRSAVAMVRIPPAESVESKGIAELVTPLLSSALSAPLTAICVSDKARDRGQLPVRKQIDTPL